jgi:hypothetical protein
LRNVKTGCRLLVVLRRIDALSDVQETAMIPTIFHRTTLSRRAALALLASVTLPMAAARVVHAEHDGT